MIHSITLSVRLVMFATEFETVQFIAMPTLHKDY